MPPPSGNNENKSNALKESYWQELFCKAQEYKINFKHCLLIVGRHIEKLLFSIGQIIIDLPMKILKSIQSIRQKIRPGRHYPRLSKKPRGGWQAAYRGKIAKTGA